jgi:thymidylate synthase (FAD)
MLEHCRAVLPELFHVAGARCERLGYCPEGEKFTCGRFPPRGKTA